MVTALIHRRIDEWFDMADENRRVLYLLLVFVPAVWSFALLTHAANDLHKDLTEIYAWSLSPAWGYDLHPPVGAWLAAVWFAIFPPADWAFYLLAALNVAAGLYAVDLVARQFLKGDKRLLVLLFLLLTTAFTLHGMRLNATNLLLWAWPLATFCFLRAFKTREAGWAFAAGLTAAITMLCKYYSGILIIGFILAAVTHPKRRLYFRSASPWLSALTGLAVLAPNIVWLVQAKGLTLLGGMARHVAASLLGSAASGAEFLLATVAYCSALLVAFAYAARPRWQTAVASLWPHDPDLRLLAVIFVCCLLLPGMFALALRLSLVSLWSLPAIFPLPILLLAPDHVRISRERAVRVAQAVIAVAAVLILTTPAQAYVRLVFGSRDGKDHFRPITQELDRIWRKATDQRLAFVTGTQRLAASVTFYHPDHPRLLTALDDSSPFGPAGASGTAIVCARDRRDCLTLVDLWRAAKPRSQRHEIEVTRVVAGIRGRPGRYVVLISPPADPARSSSPATAATSPEPMPSHIE